MGEGPLRVLVCGGRDYADRRAVYHVLDRIELEHGISCIIHGAARGADALADDWAYDDVHHPTVRVERYRANWKKFGPAAGPIRNQQMLERSSPSVVVAFPGGRGTANMVALAQQARVRVIDMRGLEPTHG